MPIIFIQLEEKIIYLGKNLSQETRPSSHVLPFLSHFFGNIFTFRFSATASVFTYSLPICISARTTQGTGQITTVKPSYSSTLTTPPISPSPSCTTGSKYLPRDYGLQQFLLFPLPRLSEKAPCVNKAAVLPHVSSPLILLTSNSPKCCSSEQPQRSIFCRSQLLPPALPSTSTSELCLQGKNPLVLLLIFLFASFYITPRIVIIHLEL